MRLVNDWRRVMRRAWSVRLIALAVVLTGLEVALPFLGDWIPPGRLGLLAGLVSAAALPARLIAQKGFEDEDQA